MKIIWWPLCLLRHVPGDYLAKQTDADTGREWFTRAQVRFFGFPMVSVAEGYRSDRGLMEHELEHVSQFWWAWWYGALVMLIAATVALMAGLPDWRWLSLVLPGLLHPALYAFSRWYRLRCEAKAYRAQMDYPDRFGNHLSFEGAAARLFSPAYDLRISFSAAINAMGRA